MRRSSPQRWSSRAFGSIGGQEVVDAAIADRRNAKAGDAGGHRGRFADGMHGQLAHLLKLLAREVHGIGAGEKDRVEAIRVGRRPVDRARG